VTPPGPPPAAVQAVLLPAPASVWRRHTGRHGTYWKEYPSKCHRCGGRDWMGGYCRRANCPLNDWR
jgi:hypothetical protein